MEEISYLNILSYIVIIYVIVKFLSSIYRIFYPYFIATPIDLKKAAGGEWAVVTGSTDGIGKEYAIQLAQKGFNIILIARNPTKLKNVKKEINEIVKNTKIATITFDFSNGSYELYEKILIPQLQKYEIGVLVNNVGVAFEYPYPLHQIEDASNKIYNITTVNILPLTILTSAVIPQMISRNKGIIINISSASGLKTISGWNVYSSSKRYIIHLTEILQKEYNQTKIIIQCICPFFVCTNMTKFKQASFFLPNPKKYVDSALNTIGKVKQTSGFFAHQIQTEIINITPTIFLDIFVFYFNKYLKKNAQNTQNR